MTDWVEAVMVGCALFSVAMLALISNHLEKIANILGMMNRDRHDRDK